MYKKKNQSVHCTRWLEELNVILTVFAYIMNIAEIVPNQEFGQLVTREAVLGK